MKRHSPTQRGSETAATGAVGGSRAQGARAWSLPPGARDLCVPALHSVPSLGAETGSTGVRRETAPRRGKVSGFRPMGTEPKATRAVCRRGPGTPGPRPTCASVGGTSWEEKALARRYMQDPASERGWKGDAGGAGRGAVTVGKSKRSLGQFRGPDPGGWAGQRGANQSPHSLSRGSVFGTHALASDSNAQVCDGKCSIPIHVIQAIPFSGRNHPGLLPTAGQKTSGRKDADASRGVLSRDAGEEPW